MSKIIDTVGLPFPARYTFNLVRDTETGTQSVVTCLTSNKKVKIENIKYSDVRHFSLRGTQSIALLGVKDIESPEQLAEVMETLMNRWGCKDA